MSEPKPKYFSKPGPKKQFAVKTSFRLTEEQNKFILASGGAEFIRRLIAYAMRHNLTLDDLADD